MTSDQDTTRLGKRLDTWKEIGSFFGRDERTVKRWETTRGLPVHRVPGSGRANVYAYTAELTEWLNSAGSRPDPEETSSDSTTAAHTATPQSENFFAKHRSWSKPALLVVLALLVTCTVVLVLTARRNSAKLASISATPTSAYHKPDPRAEDLYLKGIYHWHKRTPESLHQAVDDFTQAIVRDPNYAEAYVGLANCYNLLREYSSMPEQEAYARAKAAAERAIALDDTLSGAHSSLAFVDFFGFWDASNAEKEFQRALALDPNSVSAHHWYATFLLTVGRFPQSIVEIDKAQKLDPQSASILADRGLILYHAGRKEEGILVLRELENSDPAFLSSHVYLADIYLEQGNDRNFLSESRIVATLKRDDNRMKLVVAGEKGFAASGEKGMLTGILNAQKSLYGQGQLSAYEVARTCARLGDQREAQEFLQAAYNKREPQLLALRVDVAFAKFRSDPSFQEILTKVGLAAS
jgi:tetratricopeptide (TPR) repeat protein